MHVNSVARIASLIGEPARTAMLLQLMDGRALTANELARAAGVSPATASRVGSTWMLRAFSDTQRVAA